MDDLRELKDDFAIGLRRKNHGKIAIDGYLIHTGFIVEKKSPTIAPAVARERLGAYIDALLTRPNRCTCQPPQYARGHNLRIVTMSASPW
ncbi:hypothetical protein [Nocardia sp. NPDC006630]|uniref:hypothetical protein n=1 Tax=Nocardia sp. NPDC006630 TaxID=3157181 RepID=UPI0033B7AEE3